MEQELKLLLEQLENIKSGAKEKMDCYFDNSSNCPCEYNMADLQQKRYDTICEIFEIVNSAIGKLGDSK